MRLISTVLIAASLVTGCGTQAISEGADRVQVVEAAAGRGDSPFVGRSDGQLVLHSAVYRPTGVDAYSATGIAGNFTCGPVWTDEQLGDLFSALPDGSIVRTWMFQFLATGAGGVRNWAGFDRVIDRANQHGIKLIAVIGNYQSGTGGCDDGAPKTTAWYRGGYAQVATWQSQSYVDYAKSFVQRYRNEPTIAIIEYMNEPAVSGTCNQADAANAMRSFFDAMAKQVKALDPNHLFGSGAYGGDQCGVGTSYAKLHESPGIDVASFHDYSSGSTTLDATLSQRLKEVSKPLIVGESGIKASDSVTCGATRDVRAAQHKAKRSAQFSAGADAYIMWNAWPVPNDACVYENLNAVDPSVGW